MSNERLVAKFYLEFNRINSEQNTSISLKAIDLNLTKATNLFILEMARNAAFNKDAAHYIREVEVNNDELSVKEFTKYSSLAVHKNDLLRSIKYRVVAKKMATSEPVDILIHPVQSDEIETLRFDPVWKPDYNFRETIYREVSDGIEIVHNGIFEIDKVYCDYYKKHPDIISYSIDYKNEYAHSGSDSGLLLTNSNQDDIIVQLAVLFASANVADIQTFNTKKDEILSSLAFVKNKLV